MYNSGSKATRKLLLVRVKSGDKTAAVLQKLGYICIDRVEGQEDVKEF